MDRVGTAEDELFGEPGSLSCNGIRQLDHSSPRPQVLPAPSSSALVSGSESMRSAGCGQRRADFWERETAGHDRVRLVPQSGGHVAAGLLHEKLDEGAAVKADGDQLSAEVR